MNNLDEQEIRERAARHCLLAGDDDRDILLAEVDRLRQANNRLVQSSISLVEAAGLFKDGLSALLKESDPVSATMVAVMVSDLATKVTETTDSDTLVSAAKHVLDEAFHIGPRVGTSGAYWIGFELGDTSMWDKCLNAEIARTVVDDCKAAFLHRLKELLGVR